MSATPGPLWLLALRPAGGHPALDFFVLFPHENK